MELHGPSNSVPLPPSLTEIPLETPPLLLLPPKTPLRNGHCMVTSSFCGHLLEGAFHGGAGSKGPMKLRPPFRGQTSKGTNVSLRLTAVSGDCSVLCALSFPGQGKACKNLQKSDETVPFSGCPFITVLSKSNGQQHVVLSRKRKTKNFPN